MNKSVFFNFWVIAVILSQIKACFESISDFVNKGIT